MNLIGNLFEDTLKDSNFRTVPNFYGLFVSLYHLSYGVPNLTVGQHTITAKDYPKLRNCLDDINCIFEMDDVPKEYYEFLNSTEREQERQNRINDLKVMNETLEDEIEKRKNANKIKIIEKSYNYKFILDRLEQYGEKEVERLISIYFDRKTGSYMIDRYENKINRLGFSPDVYKNFFSIEENFLDEEYHPFNNLFLCVYMEWVSHVDVDRNDESLYAKSITGAIANLIYHKFVTDEKEKDFIELIKSVDDYFKSHIDYFIENNESYKNNPRRIEVEKEARLNSLMIFKDKYKQLGIEDKFDENKSIDEIRTIYNAELNAIIESQITSSKPDEDFKDENVIGTENDINIIKEFLDEGLSEITRKENEALTKAKAETDRKIKESEEEKTNNEESSN